MMKKVCHGYKLSTECCARFAPSIKKGVGLLAGLLFIAVSLSRALAADFQVQPTTLDLGGSVKSGAFSVINNGNEKIDLQISVKEWSQDAGGKDVYEDTKDIVFFPKIMSVEPFGQRAIRIGVKAPPSQMEKTYRLFVEEIPSPKKTPDVKLEGNIRAGLTIAFRFSTPIFVKPVRPQENYVIEGVEMSKGTVRAIVKNTGNVHIKLRAVTFSGKAVDGKELYSKEFAGWYILHGLSLPYEAAVPQELCGKLAAVDVSAQTENIDIHGTLNVQKNMCLQ
jgi:fimbrial chaperone protein